MRSLVQKSGYILDLVNNIWISPNYDGIGYNDGEDVELRIASIIQKSSDITVLSTELSQHCTDWPSLYHLSGTRANIMRPFEHFIQGDVLEIGAGCGAITRYLGECGANVLALEGSPRRAAIARSRTRDLENVTVLAEKFDQFQCGKKFDVITLIGVLEYANLFTSGDNPPLAMLKRVRSMLKPSGQLIIAIENQLGLKYFAGAPEDHLGQPMFGIEGRYRKDQPQTFGRKVLAEMLEQAGFSSSEFLAPFPDYKLPVSILTEAGFSNKNFDASAFAWQSARRDPQLPAYCNFSLELAWREIFENALGLDVANSFLVITSAKAKRIINTEVLAYHYSTGRNPVYCKETVFRQSVDGLIRVEYRRLAAPDDDAEDNANPLIKFVCPESDEYTPGEPLSFKFINLVTSDGWTFEQLAQFVRRYLAIVGQLANTVEPLTSHTKLAGEFFDAVPQNILVGKSGSHSFIDKEWQTVKPIEVGHLLFRSLLLLLGTITRIGRPSSGANLTRSEFITGVFEAAGLKLREGDLNRYILLEAEIQQIVTGRPAEKFSTWNKDQPLPLLNLSQAITERDNQLVGLNQAVSERDNQLVGLNQAVSERDQQNVGLNQAVSERDQQIFGLNQAVSERDQQIFGLNQAVSERDQQNVGLKQTFLEYEGRISNLNQAVAERDGQITNLVQTVDSLIVDRDSQKAGFEQLQKAFAQLSDERDQQILQLNCAVTKRDQQIANLNQTVTERDVQVERFRTELSSMYGSKSWRLTSPLRKLVRWSSKLIAYPSHGASQSKQATALATLLHPNELYAICENGNFDKDVNPYRILLVSHYCPTRFHAGGLRILDIYALIRQQCPNVQLDLFTNHKPTIDWSVDEIHHIFHNIYFSHLEDLTPANLAALRGSPLTYDVIDLQFHQSGHQIDDFRHIGAKIVFTPMESLAKALYLDLRAKFNLGNGLRPMKIAASIRSAAEEIVFTQKADEVVCVSRTDAAFLRAVTSSRRIRGVETGVSQFEFADALEPDFEPARAAARPCRVLFVAYFGSETNVLALRWYLEHVHPLVKDRVPDYVLSVVGRGDLSPFSKFRDKSIDFVGEVPAIAPYIKEARVGIAPALGGAGFRGKVNQYAVLGCPCVVSPIAFGGLSYKDGLSIFVAGTPAVFADRCVKLLTDMELNDNMGRAARQLCLDRYSWQSKWAVIRKIYNLEEVA